eukprot:CAMPEP_0170986514 /NCGR_PEP_ID=MMETSP0736-20130129/6132_1 /TAXON_ID=186038 /ORGANISM="Fragilariopsis kerguelensis, Strain L26-C5" /LENGTH=685 /DNA_ID=CAMNT_0011410673 /DNA_START=89 /DNA_END=2148 /DNA_ORIENTATION=-
MEDVMRITPLGSGQEVGRSCHLLQFCDMTIMLDIGIHPGYDGINGLPYLDQVEPDQIDVLLVTHFHLDHAASLPYLTERTSFKGRIFMTHPTKAVTDYYLVIIIACMFWLDIGGRTLLYTGDYSMEDDRHLMAAELPEKKPDVLMCESTYGVQVHASRAEREARFTGTVERVVSRGGRCLIPVFALGRAQELLLILDEYWQANPQLQNIPIWYASKLASRALRVYQTYANMMNARIRSQMDVSNPFSFNYIKNLKSIDVNNFNDSGPSVVFASPGMLQSGVSRQLFDRWASDPQNGVLIAGYAVEHTLAKEIMNQPTEVVHVRRKTSTYELSVDYVSFSAHVDFVQNRSFITQVDPKHIILVHGQKDEMGRLKSALLLQYRKLPENKRPTITMPPNLQTVSLKFARRRSAKVMGSLALKESEPVEGEEVQGVLVTHNFTSKIVKPDDLAAYTPLRVGSISSKLHVPFTGSIETLRLFLSEMFSGLTETQIVEDDIDGQKTCHKFSCYQDKVSVHIGKTERVAIVEWEASPAGDVVADALIALIMHAQSSAASIRLSSKPCRHPRADNKDEGNSGEEESSAKKPRHDATSLTENRLRLIKDTLKDQFDRVEAVYEGNSASYDITTDIVCDSGVTPEEEPITCTVNVSFPDDSGEIAEIKVECLDKKLASNVQECLRNLTKATSPLS